MQAETPQLAAGIAALVAFAVARMTAVWRLIADGPHPFLLIPAIFFPIAVAPWASPLYSREGIAAWREYRRL